jgi:hypothetical protein
MTLAKSITAMELIETIANRSAKQLKNGTLARKLHLIQAHELAMGGKETNCHQDDYQRTKA